MLVSTSFEWMDKKSPGLRGHCLDACGLRVIANSSVAKLRSGGVYARVRTSNAKREDSLERKEAVGSLRAASSFCISANIS